MAISIHRIAARRSYAAVAGGIATAMLSAAGPAHAHVFSPFGGPASSGLVMAGESTPVVPVPKAACGPGSLPEKGLQGQVPRSDLGFVLEGYRCNLELVGSLPADGADIVLAWHEDCAYMSTRYAPVDPESATKQGTIVIDASDPSAPKEVGRLQTPAMISPHESLKVNPRRGLLAASQAAGPYFDVYDISDDCRRPQLRASVELPGGSGHEGDFTPDGLTYYHSTILNPPAPAIIPIDLRDPSRPQPLMQWQNPLDTAAGFHGVGFSEDGNVGYLAAQQGPENGLAIVDVSDVQTRRENPQIRMIGKTRWGDGNDVQAVVPARIGGRSYIVANDEFGAHPTSTTTACQAGQPPFGFARLIDIEDPAHPKVVAKLPLEVSDPKNCSTIVPEHSGATTLSHSSHFCNVDDPANTAAVACSWFGAGVRVFDVRDPLRPREVAYFNPRPNPAAVRGGTLKPLVVARPEQDAVPTPVRWRKAADGTTSLWFASMQNGFQIVRLTNGVYQPAAATPPCTQAIAPRSRPTRVRLTRRAVRIAGTAMAKACGAQMGRVLVSVAHRDGRRCRFLRPSGRLDRPQSCRRLRYLPATGAERFSLALNARLPRGRYQVAVVAIDTLGNRESPRRKPARVR